MEFKRLVLLIVYWACLIAPDDANGKQADEFRHAAECGDYALIAVAKALDVDVDVGAVLVNTRTSVVPWSTSIDICDAAHKLRLWSAPFHGVTSHSLRSASRPLIVLLKTEMRDECAGHWVAYLGEDQGQAIVFDILDAGRVRTMGYGELSMLMSGDAVMIGVSPPSIWERVRWQYSTLESLWPLAFFCFIALIPQFKAYWNTRRMTVQISALSFASVCFLFLHGFSTKVSLWSEPALVAWVQSKHLGDTFAEVQVNQLLALQGHKELTLVDARLPAQFAAGHIPGALNLPVSIRASDLAERARKIPRKQLVIVYCNSRECDWDQTMARRLSALGFTNIRVFEDGMATYAQHVWQSTP